MRTLPASGGCAGSADVTRAGAELAAQLAGGGVLALTGAGMSTASGIPDYRGPTGARRRGDPMTYGEFVKEADGRQRYWARSYLGWRQIATARPNDAHAAVAELQRRGLVGAVVTQNVDGLHQAAGSHRVLELHGSLSRVVCLDCGSIIPRGQLDRRLEAANPDFAAAVAAAVDALRVNPDGDVDVPEELVASFAVVPCPVCETGRLKPDVVFFGESVPKERVEQVFALLGSARLLLVLGSSLTVMSGYRFVRAAAREGTPVVIVTDGPTRGDDDATLKLAAPVQDLLPAALELLGASGHDRGAEP